MNLELAIYPDPVLRVVTQKIETVDDEIIQLANAMHEYMVINNGIGLAAPQVKVSKSLLVIAYEDEGIEPITLINPVITSRLGMVEMSEGCLSFPGIFVRLKRPEFVTVEATLLTGERKVIEADALLARVIQHEMDHLEGRLFIDLFSPVQKIKWRSALKELERSYNLGQGV